MKRILLMITTLLTMFGACLVTAYASNQADVAYQFAKPWRIADANTCTGNVEGIFCGVPIL